MIRNGLKRTISVSGGFELLQAHDNSFGVYVGYDSLILLFNTLFQHYLTHEVSSITFYLINLSLLTYTK